MTINHFKVLFVSSIAALGIALGGLLMPVAVTQAAGPTCTVPGTYATIQAALADAGCTTITLGSQTYSNTNVTIDHTVTLNGAGAANTILDGGGNNSVITVTAGSVAINNLKIQNGSSNAGGGILLLTGTVTLNSTTVYSNSAFFGGNIANGGTLIVNNSQINNGIAFFGGGLFSGALTNNAASATFTNSDVSNNMAFVGGGIVNITGTLTMNGGNLNNNSAIFGGGLFQGDDLFFIVPSPIQSTSVRGRRVPGGKITLAPKAGTSIATLTNLNISNNTASDTFFFIPILYPIHVGGGVFNGSNADLTMTNVGVNGNSAVGSPSNLACSGNCMLEAGGGIFNIGTLTANSSTFNNNSATGTGTVTTTLQIAQGGGISNDGTMNLTNVIFSNNQAVSNAGASTDADMASYGGGISNGAVFFNAPLRSPLPLKQPKAVGATLDKVTFNNNASTVSGNVSTFSFAVGGGMVEFSSGPSPIKKRTWATQNKAPTQGPISSLLTNVTFNANSSTVTSNNAASFGGAIAVSGSGLQLVNVTIAGNSTTTPGNAGGVDAGSADFLNVLLANNTNGNCDFTPVSLGGNISSDNTCNLSGSGDKNNASQAGLLGPLANNGGREQTMALLAGNPAIDGGVSAGCPTTDERGVPRPQGGRCDSGAYEGTPAAADVPEGDTLLLLTGGMGGLGVWLRYEWNKRKRASR